MTNYKMTTPIPTSVTTPDSVDSSIGTLEYFDGVATPDTVSNVYDYLDRSRAVEVFLNSIPTMSAEVAFVWARPPPVRTRPTRCASSTR